MKDSYFFIFSVVAFCLICLLAVTSIAWSEEPQMMQTIDAPTIVDWIGQENPQCAEQDKLFTLEYDKLAVDCKSGPPRRYRTWECATTGEMGVDVEHLPLWFCQ